MGSKGFGTPPRETARKKLRASKTRSHKQVNVAKIQEITGKQEEKLQLSVLPRVALTFKQCALVALLLTVAAALLISCTSREVAHRSRLGLMDSSRIAGCRMQSYGPKYGRFAPPSECRAGHLDFIWDNYAHMQPEQQSAATALYYHSAK